ncbi:phosphotransferase family protein [Leifsonia sp. Leaf264]|uniref:phosphotransferase family protein n=1 Tax=Leifsonia sp. Leaf264 TaxID=1736314 RepID=UPI0006FADE2D|nr:phosphotransferase [Leifsonia sp. Leaf264]KQO98659.1 hypothetical protein ASF30_11395 [Leifsonia sp. Leaf264]
MDAAPHIPALLAALSLAGFEAGTLTPFDDAGRGGGSKRWTALSDTGFVVRCADTGDDRIQPAETELDWALRFAEHVKVQRPLLAVPIRFESWTATVWEHVVASGEVTGAHAFEHGQVLRRLHDRVSLRGDERFAANDQLSAARRRIDQLCSVDRSTAHVLRTYLTDAETFLEAEGELPNVALHGDSLNHNLLSTTDGLVLIDFDSSSPGPSTVDLATGLLSYRHHLRDEGAVAQFFAGYGPLSFDQRVLDRVVWVKRFRQACTHAARGDDIASRLDELDSLRAILT